MRSSLPFELCDKPLAGSAMVGSVSTVKLLQVTCLHLTMLASAASRLAAATRAGAGLSVPARLLSAAAADKVVVVKSEKTFQEVLVWEGLARGRAVRLRHRPAEVHGCLPYHVQAPYLLRVWCAHVPVRAGEAEVGPVLHGVVVWCVSRAVCGPNGATAQVSVFFRTGLFHGFPLTRCAGPCRRIAPVFAELRYERGGGTRLLPVAAATV